MKAKKLFSLMLALAMVLSAMGFSAIAKDEADYSDVIFSISAEEIQENGLTYAVQFKGNTMAKGYTNWKMDVELVANKDITLDVNNSTDGHLSVNLPNYQIPGWRDMPQPNLFGNCMDSIELKADEPIKVLEYYMTDIFGSNNTKAGYEDLFGTHKDLSCGVKLSDEFIAAHPDLYMEFSLKIYELGYGSEVKNTVTLASYTIGEKPVAEVGGEKYTSIDDAIAAWTNGTTLTLLDDVELSDVITLKSTEHHTLNLGTYTLTAASGKDAIEITCEGRSSASYALTIEADSKNPGGITAKGKACIYYKKSGSTKDRPIIRIYNGVFNGSYSINCTSNGNTNCPQVWIYGGQFNSYMNLTKTMLRVWGGYFDCSINCTGDQNAYRQFYGGTFKHWQFMTADAPNKFVVGSEKGADANTLGTYDVGVYVDANGYLVVGGDVITAPTKNFTAHTSTYTGWSSYLKYSSAAEYGLYYEDTELAFEDVKSATVTLYEDYNYDVKSNGALVVDCSEGAVFGSDVKLNSTSASFTIILPYETAEYEGTVTQYDASCYITINEEIVDGKKIITYTQTKNPVDAGYDSYLTREGVQFAYKFDEAIETAEAGDKITLLKDVVYNIGADAAAVMAIDENVVIDLNGNKLSPEDPNLPTFVASEKYSITNGTIEGNIVVAGNVVFENVNVEGNIEVESGNVEIESGFVAGAIVSENNAEVEITGGKFTEDPTEYVAEGYDVVRYADYYIVTNLSEEAKAISVEFVKTDVENDEDNAEGTDTYNIVLKANVGDIINELASADLTFKFDAAPVKGGDMAYTVVPAAGMALTQIKDRYMFNYDGATKVEESGEAIVIGTITIDGYGKYTLTVVDADTNIVNATTVNDNLVDYYIKNGDKDASAATGGLIINTDTVAGDDLIGSIDTEIAVPVRTLTINIDFPNEVKDQAALYQDMKVEITGNIDGVNQTVKYDLGGNMINGSYVVTDERLVLNNAYTVTVSGAGYRTARYTVTMTENKVLKFWNNVMDEAQFVEIGKDSSKVNVTFLAGDIVKDNKINIYDLSAVVSYFGTSTTVTEKDTYAKYDLNRDGVIDSKDVAYVLVSWNN